MATFAPWSKNESFAPRIIRTHWEQDTKGGRDVCAHLQDYVSNAGIAVSQPDPETYGDEGAAQGDDDRPERQEVHHGRVDPRAAVHPQAEGHEDQGEDGRRDGHDDAESHKTH